MLWNSTLDAPVGLPICVARAPLLHCISAAPAALDRYPRGVAGHVAHPVRSILAPTLVTLPSISLIPPARFERRVEETVQPGQDVARASTLRDRSS